MTNVAQTAPEAQITEVNAFILTGDVESHKDGSLHLITKQQSGENVYEDRHVIQLPESADVDSKFTNKTKRCTVIGHMDVTEVDERRITWLVADKVKPAKAKDGFLNVARLVGEVARPYEFYPTQDGKSAFGNLLVKVGEFFGAATAFKYAAQKLKKVTRGSIVQVQGRIDYRERDSAIRMIIDPEETKVLRLVEKADPFAGIGGMQAATDDIPF